VSSVPLTANSQFTGLKSAKLVTTGRVVIIEGHEAAVDFAGPPSNYSREGRVTHFPDDMKPTWIRIQALFGGQVVEAAVGSDGKFKIYDRLDGEYLLVVFANDRVASVETRIFDERFSTDPILITSAVTGHQQ
jgi:hypothetical protein